MLVEPVEAAAELEPAVSVDIGVVAEPVPVEAAGIEVAVEPVPVEAVGIEVAAEHTVGCQFADTAVVHMVTAAPAFVPVLVPLLSHKLYDRHSLCWFHTK